MAPKKSKKNVKGKKIKKYLPFKLTDTEKAERGMEAAKLQTKHDELVFQKKQATDKFAAGIKTTGARIHTLLGQIDSGEEQREVECIEFKNFETSKVEYWHDGYKLLERDMIPEDHQLDLSVKEKKRKTADKPKDLKEKDLDIARVHREETGARSSWSVANGAR